jgi:starch synthase
MDALLADLPADEAIFHGYGVNKKVNMMANAIKRADLITTVSPTYAKEIQSVEFGNNLESLLKMRKGDLIGILNGIDTDEWNPKTDKYLNHHFDINDLSNKRLLKRELQKRFNLKTDDSVPVIGMISRIAEQKGFVELTDGSPCPLEQILDDFNVQIVIVGTGDKEIEDKLASLGQLHNNLSVNFVFDNHAAHLIEGGSDFFLMPSRYEPCGLNQMYSLRYATIPIARKTGGLADSIIDINEEGGTGFLFEQLSGAELYGTIKRALQIYNTEANRLLAIRKRGMALDFSWTNSAREYLEAYKQNLKG